MPPHFPRVLAVNTGAFGTHTPTSFMMGNLFRGWPPDRLAQICTGSTPPPTDLCTRSTGLSLADLALPRPLKRWIAGQMHQPPATLVGAAPAPPRRRRLADRLGKVRSDIYTYLHLAPYRLDGDFQRFLADFRPEVIYTLANSLETIRLVLHLSRSLDIPVVPHFMDDWPTTLFTQGLTRPLRLLLRHNLDAVLAHAPIRMAIGDSMAVEFTRRYGPRFVPFANCMDEAILAPPIAPLEPRVVAHFVYIGTLSHNRWRLLADLGKALTTLAASGVPVRATIYTRPDEIAEYAPRLAAPPVVTLAPAPADVGLRALLEDTDCFLFVDGYNRENLTFFRYSVSAKTPIYLGAGRPVLAYGPAALASIQVFADAGCGVVVEPGDPGLAAVLRDLATDPARRVSLGERGRAAAVAGYDGPTQRERFRAVLAEAAGTRP